MCLRLVNFTISISSCHFSFFVYVAWQLYRSYILHSIGRSFHFFPVRRPVVGYFLLYVVMLKFYYFLSRSVFPVILGSTFISVICSSRFAFEVYVTLLTHVLHILTPKETNPSTTKSSDHIKLKV